MATGQPDWELTKALIRYKGVADSLLAGGDGLGMYGHVMALINTTSERLTEASRPDLADDFNRVVRHVSKDYRLARTICSALAGWLQGAIDAENLEVRIQAEAAAYAEARVRAERPIGFATPPSADDE
jgi:hypothetical protein